MNDFIPSKQVNYFLNCKSRLAKYLFYQYFPEFGDKRSVFTDFTEMLSHQECQFLHKRNRNGFAGNIRKWDKIGRGTLWNLYLYALIGVDITVDFIADSVRFLNSNYLLPSGGFSFGWNPSSESSLWTGEYLYLLLNLGYQGKEIAEIKNWICSSQNSDGGWFVSPVRSFSDALRFVFSGKIKLRGNTNYHDGSCIFSTISCLRALLDYRDLYSDSSEELNEVIDHGACFLLTEQLLFKKKIESKDGFAVNTDFQSVGLSIFGQIDLIKYLDVMSRTGYKNHEFVTSVFNYFTKEKIFEEGWIFNSSADFMIEKEFGIKKYAGIDYISTLYLMKIFSRYNQL